VGLSIDQNDIKKQLNQIVKDQIKDEKELERRTLNAVSKKGLTEMARDIKEEHGVPVGQTKRRVNVINATRKSLEVEWRIRGRRLVQPGLRKVKGGVSFLGRGKVRKTRKIPVEAGGSAPFIIVGKNSGKKVAVFAKPGTKSRRIGKGNRWTSRATTTFIGHSIPYYVEENWESVLKKRMIGFFPEERKKQKKKMQFLSQKRTRRR
jgi:hypothetical protein